MPTAGQGKEGRVGGFEHRPFPSSAIWLSGSGTRPGSQKKTRGKAISKRGPFRSCSSAASKRSSEARSPDHWDIAEDSQQETVPNLARTVQQGKRWKLVRLVTPESRPAIYFSGRGRKKCPSISWKQLWNLSNRLWVSHLFSRRILLFIKRSKPRLQGEWVKSCFTLCKSKTKAHSGRKSPKFEILSSFFMVSWEISTADI